MRANINGKNENLTGFDQHHVAVAPSHSIPPPCSSSFKFTPKHTFSIQNNPMCGICLHQWLPMLFKYFHEVDWVYYPRALFITTISIFNFLLYFFEWLLWNKHINATELPPDPIFIIGHPRTGTTLLHNLLASDEDNFYYCTTFSAGFPSSFLWFEKFGKTVFSGMLGQTRPMDNMPLHFDLPQEDELAVNLLSGGTSYYMPLWFMRLEPGFRKYLDFESDGGIDDPDAQHRWTTAFLYFMKKVTLRALLLKGRTPRRRLVIKSPVHTARINIMRQLFPDARFIYLHRDPYEVCQSAAHMADTTYWYCYFQVPTNEMIAEFILWQFTALWKKYNAEVIDHEETVKTGARKVKNDCLEVAYFADLVSQPLDTLRRIYRHVDVPFDEEFFEKQIESLAGYNKNTYTQLSTEVRELVNKRWIGYFEAFNYPLRTSASSRPI